MDAAPSEPPSEAAGGVRGFLRDWLTGVGGERAAPRRLQIAAWVRLLLGLPLIVIPTGVALADARATGYDPETAVALLAAWAVFAGVFIAANAAILALRADRHGRRVGLARALTYATVTAELVTNQISTHAMGTLTSHGVLYTAVLIAIYRVFFDYRIGLYAVLLGSALYVGSAFAGFTGVVPAHPIAPEFDHLLHHDAKLAATVVYVVVVGLFVMFCSVNYAVNQSAKLHHYITESVLRRYLPPSLVERAARGELRLDAEPERRVVTVMFTDLVGFTSISERIGERDVARLLNRYLSRCADVAHAHGATVDKFIGDAVMVLLGAPDALEPEEQAKRCVELARDMQAALDDTPMQMRAGINTGEVIVGHFGSKARSDFTAVGHAVNLAARLESACEPGRVLVGEETARLLRPHMDVEPAGEFQLKGISRPVRAYYVTPPEPSAAAAPL